MVLRHYGRRMMPPDERRPKERNAAAIWEEALARLEPLLVAKGIIRADPVFADQFRAMALQMEMEMEKEMRGELEAAE